MSFRSLSSLYLAICGAYFAYFFLLAILGLSLYILQTVTISGNIYPQTLYNEDLSDTDKALVKWFRWGIIFSAIVSIFYAIQLITLIDPRLNRRA